ncbi:MAG TPA: ABC transporter permease [Bacteroidetes bacterium]|nr:ABC transporter permease [Bacteroidota bacterium]
MRIILRVIYESLAQAMQQLRGNKLRTLLSLLGVTIGIFCIIGVQSAVDSLKDNVMGSLNKLGDDVVYISKMPWAEDPGHNFWKYRRRPSPDFDDYEAIKRKVKSASLVNFNQFIGVRTAKWRSNSVERVYVGANTYDFFDIFNVELQKGRYYTRGEYERGENKVLIGDAVAEGLFGDIDPIGKHFKLSGRDMEVIGVYKKSGKDILKIMNFDPSIGISYPLAKRIANVKNVFAWGAGINVKAAEGYSLDYLIDEVTGVLRAERRLKPKEKNNFALNYLSILAGLMDQLFGMLNILGLVIGVFAMIVGMVSVANIMFVSVKERTNIIGIKKAIGAKKGVILLEFLVESVILCIIGGIIGLGLVFLIFELLKDSMPFPIYLDFNNSVYGLGLSVFVGVLAGFIPALRAANMDPVVAIRHAG